MAQLGHVWAQVGLSMRNLVLWEHLAPKLGPRQAQCVQHGLTRTPIKVALGRKISSGWAQLGPGLPPKGPNLAQLGPKSAVGAKKQMARRNCRPLSQDSNYYRYMHSTMHMGSKYMGS